MRKWQRGDFVEFDGLLAVVVGAPGDPEVPEDHVMLWFGEPRGRRRSEGGTGAGRPEVCTVPAEYCQPSPEPILSH